MINRKLFYNTFIMVSMIMLTHLVIAQTDSLSSADGSEEDWGLLMFGLIGILFIFVSIGVGIAIAGVLLIILTALVSLGILSTAIWYGWYKNSLEKGFNVFVLLSVTALTSLLGTLGMFGLNYHFKWMSNMESIVYGASGSLLVGLVLGMIVLYLLKKVILYMIKKYKLDQ